MSKSGNILMLSLLLFCVLFERIFYECVQSQKNRHEEYNPPINSDDNYLELLWWRRENCPF